ncbi:MAG: hypothetical protein A3D24_04195 [Candidatus Blackburnbacteria bacterium RIFCSPHIGHO2_02_FULL_39_13]|uniref:Uncharacterized protein n=1 Tax=Candidatus Blackburnbacteria bacterium RIFCSPLOWO2_01_FULL_40_20 TaxID=1797519 RepID=A0A1G1VAP8_9BACT|nr:MAG: hypothetical protein A2694_01970 [Candidatus Blackburnbacteria bacterium RIFCSPHIGHO2_01_FULL_40_17]OGY09858.1 MAG: hypothetical protein A3D24_04195 [Candidatus Blackburnbacteria bacterium RIFCSPHIGHO2_02_FULL_39_13]OGY12469.1 MAG: hypothetical protein A3A77_00635 [Candidatus Blackburnbacteria bacterium RIFCSPLOWO2_01_FULL_40_20]HBL52330.1 hypothetical protein [Candidatus Blackburnbacteria bacterium]
MSFSDPRFIYILVSLPIMFGVTLVADGIAKILHEKNCGWISLFSGIVFLLTMGVVILLLQ